MKIKKEQLFRIISVLFLSFLFIFFSSRLVYNYMLENKTKNEISSLLSDKIISTISKENLSYSNKKYTLSGQIDNNYISYSGLLWRVLEIENDNIKIVSDNSVTLLPWGNNKEYIESNIYNWIHGEQGIKNNLTNIDEYLEKSNFCINNANEISITKCQDNNDYISILSMNDYINAGASDSFLNNSTYFWLAATNNQNHAWYVFDNGGIKTDTDNSIYGVRPIVILKSMDYIYGNGTIDSPYLISNDPVDTLSEIELGNYIKYSDYIWKVVSKNHDSVKVVLTEPLTIENKEIKKAYSKKYDTFKLDDTNGIAYYLNNTFYETLKNKSYLKKGYFYIGKYDLYNLEELYDQKVNTYVGLLTIGDIFLNENNSMYLLSSITSNNTIPVVKENSTLFYNFSSYESSIKPVIYLDNKIEVKGGIGDINYPFELR